MTLLEPLDVADDEEPTIPGDGEERRSSRRSLTSAQKRRVALGVAVAVSIVTTVVLLEGPIAQLMYAQRQRERTAQYLDAAGAAAVDQGDAVAVLQAPAIGLNVAVVEGDSAANLRGGPGHRRGTPLPGEEGNSVILGRRRSFGGPFRRLDELAPGMLISVQVRASLSAVDYLVREVRRVPEHDVSTLLPAAEDGSVLTLVTSEGGRFSQERLVVIADYDAGLPLAPRSGASAPPPAQALAVAAESSSVAPPLPVDDEVDVDDAPFDSGVTFLGVVIVLVWLGVLAAILANIGGLRRRFPVWLTTIVLLPVIGVVVLQLWFALDGLGPVTR